MDGIAARINDVENEWRRVRESADCFRTNRVRVMKEQVEELELELELSRGDRSDGGHRRPLFARLASLRASLVDVAPVRTRPIRRPTVRVSKLQPCTFADIPTDVESCSICLDEFERDERKREFVFVRTQCSHFFHARCLHTWILACQHTCPTCRTDMFHHACTSTL